MSVSLVFHLTISKEEDEVFGTVSAGSQADGSLQRSSSLGIPELWLSVPVDRLDGANSDRKKRNVSL